MLSTKYLKKSQIIKGNGTDLIFAKFSNNKSLLASLNDKTYFIGKNKEASYRIINHWAEIGLIDESRKKETGWRKFSIVDLVWQRIILELRKFGFPNEKILKIKDCLIDIKNETGKHFPLFEFYIGRAMQKNATFLIVYEDGFADLGTDKEIGLSEEMGLLNQNYIRISLNDLLARIFKNGDFQPTLEISLYLNDGEQKVIEMLNDGNVESVEIILKNGKIDLMKSKEKIDVQKKIVDIMKEKKYQTITVKMDGSNKPAYILRESKEKISATE